MMSDLTDLLDEIQDRADLAWDEHMYDMTCPEEVLDDIRRLVAALRGVLATHQEDTCKCCQRGTACRECRAPWPCPTVREITEALGAES